MMTNEGIVILGWLAIITVCIILMVCVAQYAKRLGRTECWCMFSLVLTPLFPMICLFLLGETDLHRELRIIEEEKWKTRLNRNQNTVEQ